jgi:uncharacterized protein YdhG (YjbR/CyaY superfamily)
MKSQPTPDTINAYIATFPPKVRAILKKIRATVKKAAPKATEKISYRMPAFFQDGVVLYFAAFKSHIGVFPPVSGDDKLLATLGRYRGPKGNLKFPLDEPIPLNLITRIVKLRLKQNGERARAKKLKK